MIKVLSHMPKSVVWPASDRRLQREYGETDSGHILVLSLIQIAGRKRPLSVWGRRVLWWRMMMD